ncbi:CBS domain containing membrane protein [Desulfobulbus propionicus DSM 2032]|jgi:CBS-domain-containing membrane protein|uniref:CBS domain containing membrane protein n=1 Tax=Desulfobulbus propionicus (strain ATCC 33891 / DSM 2032 / VKM B-1956 / 1pr3) TaxID=577650 RepID=A0A7U3YKV9_DESPD|nr:CBS domain-containing protein [Desulfobulbus propionicus]ADW17263.1 CBS domain containing membrane protein [Desulfobulbus propionicus DSM 2032]
MLKAQDIMTREVITVNARTSVRELAALLLSHKISGAPVVDEAGKVIGVVTESDLIFQNKKVHLPTAFAILDAFVFLEPPDRMKEELRKMAGTRVGDICSTPLISVGPETDLEELATLMAEKKMHTLPVMAEGTLVGVIGKSDIIRTIAQGM